MKIVLKQFPTHIAKTNNKYASNEYLKINNQAIYSGVLNRFGRAIVVKNLHIYIMSQIPRKFKPPDTPTRIKILIRTVYNHGSISMRNGRICWKPVKKDYKPNWDIFNLAAIWIKVIEDSLTHRKVIIDDNVKYVRGGSYDVEFVNHIDDREIIITFEKVN